MSLGPEWFVVEQRGFDSSGRALRNTKYMWAIWDALREHPAIKPFAWKLTMVQSGFMGWGGASASDGFHRLGGCCDVRTWNLTTSEINSLVWVGRSVFALGIYRRDTSWLHGGMAPHAHWSQGGDRPQSEGSQISWNSYVGGRAGLVSVSTDYERRPSPLVLVPPAWVFEEELTMDAEVRKAFANVHEHITNARKATEEEIDLLSDAESKRAIADRRRDREAAEKAKTVATRMINKLGSVQDAVGEIDSALAQGDVKIARTRLALLASSTSVFLKADDDVDGVDNPADEDA